MLFNMWLGILELQG